MTEPVINSILVDFEVGNSTSGLQDGALIRVESDTRELDDGGLNVRTTPLYTDPYYLLVYTNMVTNVQVQASSGKTNLSPYTETRELTEYITFDNTASQTLPYPAKSVQSMRWLGADLGTANLVNNLILNIAEAGVGVLEIKYTTEYQILQLTAPQDIVEGQDEWHIAVVVSGEEIIEGV